jgi:hypothetical protein
MWLWLWLWLERLQVITDHDIIPTSRAILSYAERHANSKDKNL